MSWSACCPFPPLLVLDSGELERRPSAAGGAVGWSRAEFSWCRVAWVPGFAGLVWLCLRSGGFCLCCVVLAGAAVLAVGCCLVVVFGGVSLVGFGGGLFRSGFVGLAGFGWEVGWFLLGFVAQWVVCVSCACVCWGGQACGSRPGLWVSSPLLSLSWLRGWFWRFPFSSLPWLCVVARPRCRLGFRAW